MTGSAFYTSFAASAPVSIPDAPGIVSAAIASPITTTVKWNSVPRATGYRIERASGLTGGAYSVVATLTNGETEFDDAGLTTGTTYRYRVSSINSAGISTASPIAIVTPSVTTSLALPGTFAATQTAAGGVTLTWTGTTSSVGVLVERSLDAGLSWTTLITVPGSQHSYVDGTVTTATNYAYRISSKSFTAVSPKSGSVSLMSPPPKVDALQRTSITDSAASFTWTAAIGATGYLLEGSADDGKTWTPMATLAGGVVATTVTGLDSGTDYTFRISATNAGGSSATTQIIGVLTVPSTPKNIDCALVDGPGVQITFDPVVGASSYLIERRTDGRPWGTLIDLDAPATTYTDVQVDGVRTYEYRVTAENESGSSQPSEAVAQGSSSSGDGEGVTPPDNLHASPGTAKGTVNVTWDSGGGEDGFTVEQMVGKVYKEIATVSGDTHTVAVKGVVPGKNAVVRVTALVDGVPSNPSEALTFTAAPLPVKSIKTLAATTSDSVTITWATPTGATFYRVERSTDGGTTWDTLEESLNTAAYVDSTVDPGTTYRYRVSAGNDTGYAAPSSSLILTTGPQTPVGVNIASGAKGTATLTWGDVSGETGYKLQGSTDGSSWKQIGAAKANQTSASIKPGKNTLFRVLAFNKTATSSPSSPATLEVSNLPPTSKTKTKVKADLFSAAPVQLLLPDDIRDHRDLFA